MIFLKKLHFGFKFGLPLSPNHYFHQQATYISLVNFFKEKPLNLDQVYK